MLTPRFELTQDDNFVIVEIKTPYVKISDVDFFIGGREFKFFVKPYFLRLNLPGEVIEDGREGAAYDVDKGTFTVKIPKLNVGQEFPDLDMITTLLAPKNKLPAPAGPMIEVVNDGEEKAASFNSDEIGGGGDADDGDDSSDFDWEIEQVFPHDNLKLSMEEEEKYGFARQKSGILKRRQEELFEIADIQSPESMSLSQIRTARLSSEDLKFDPEHYLADYFDEESIQHILAFRPPWTTGYRQSSVEPKAGNITVPEFQTSNSENEEINNQSENTVQLTEKEKDKMRRLPNKEYILDEGEQKSLLLGLVDIMFAYAYNYRTTEGENTVESAWTVNKLSATLSWFESFTSLHDVVSACCRRSLSYPLHRNWKICERVFEDTKALFDSGRHRLLRCLLEIHDLFNQDDPRYLLNDLYVTDYCVWIQKVSKKKLKSLAQSLHEYKLKISDVGWELDELVSAAKSLEEETDDENDDDEESTDDSDESSDDSGESTGDSDTRGESEQESGNATARSHQEDSNEPVNNLNSNAQLQESFESLSLQETFSTKQGLQSCDRDPEKVELELPESCGTFNADSSLPKAAAELQPNEDLSDSSTEENVEIKFFSSDLNENQSQKPKIVFLD